MKSQMPNTVYRACILEECSAPYTLSTHLTEQDALNKLAAEQHKFNPNCRENVWLWIETVKNGEVTNKQYVDAGVKSIEAEECAA